MGPFRGPRSSHTGPRRASVRLRFAVLCGLGGSLTDLLDCAEDHRRGALDGPAHQVPGAVAVMYLGEPLLDRHELAVRAGGHVAASQNAGQHVRCKVKFVAQDIGESAFAGFDDGAGMMGDQPTQYGIGVLRVAKVPGGPNSPGRDCRCRAIRACIGNREQPILSVLPASLFGITPLLPGQATWAGMNLLAEGPVRRGMGRSSAGGTRTAGGVGHEGRCLAWAAAYMLTEEPLPRWASGRRVAGVGGQTNRPVDDVGLVTDEGGWVTIQAKKGMRVDQAAGRGAGGGRPAAGRD